MKRLLIVTIVSIYLLGMASCGYDSEHGAPSSIPTNISNVTAVDTPIPTVSEVPLPEGAFVVISQGAIPVVLDDFSKTDLNDKIIINDNLDSSALARRFTGGKVAMVIAPIKTFKEIYKDMVNDGSSEGTIRIVGVLRADDIDDPETYTIVFTTSNYTVVNVQVAEVFLDVLFEKATTLHNEGDVKYLTTRQNQDILTADEKLRRQSLRDYLYANISLTNGLSSLFDDISNIIPRIKMITIANISGVTVPVTDGSSAKAIVSQSEYSGTIRWNPNNDTFKPNQIYQAIVTLTANKGYTLDDVPGDFFKVNGADKVVFDGVTLTVTFPRTSARPLTLSRIEGIALPEAGVIPATKIIGNNEYDGSVSWIPPINATFAHNTEYTASIGLSANTDEGYDINNVSRDFFAVSGAKSVSYENGVITAVFPKTLPETIIVYFNDDLSTFRNFDFDKQMAAIQEAANIINNTSNGIGKVYVDGYIYNRNHVMENNESDEKLSEDRAKAVVAELRQRGVTVKIESVAHGIVSPTPDMGTNNRCAKIRFER